MNYNISRQPLNMAAGSALVVTWVHWQKCGPKTTVMHHLPLNNGKGSHDDSARSEDEELVKKKPSHQRPMLRLPLYHPVHRSGEFLHPSASWMMDPWIQLKIFILLDIEIQNLLL